LLCADLDQLGDQLADVRSKLLTSPHLWALFLSPTGDGLKCVFRVRSDAGKQKASFRAVEKHVRALTGIQIDQSCSDLARLCFLSHDPDAYLNDNAAELAPLASEKSEDGKSASICEAKIQIRRRIASELMGEIDWSTEANGCCPCRRNTCTPAPMERAIVRSISMARQRSLVFILTADTSLKD
jgi:hypothetical protein